MAHHYQLWEQLPQEKHGGECKVWTLLSDEKVKRAVHDWLAVQMAGSVMHQLLRDALNGDIFSTLMVTPKQPLSEQTAHQWLIKLGWRLTVLQKGVYMDGHERQDAVEYQQNSFLPWMQEFEAQMAKFEGPEMERVAPDLKPGETEIIPLFQDETCFTVNEYKY